MNAHQAPFDGVQLIAGRGARPPVPRRGPGSSKDDAPDACSGARIAALARGRLRHLQREDRDPNARSCMVAGPCGLRKAPDRLRSPTACGNGRVDWSCDQACAAAVGRERPAAARHRRAGGYGPRACGGRRPTARPGWRVREAAGGAGVLGALVAGGGLHRRRAPLGAAALGRDAFGVEDVGDRLEGHAVGAHRGDALVEHGGRARLLAGARVALGARRREPGLRAFGDPLALPLRDRGERARRLAARRGRGVEVEVERDQPDLQPVEPAQQLPQLGDRPREVVQAADDQARGLAAGEPLQDMRQPGPLQRPAVPAVLAVADELQQIDLVARSRSAPRSPAAARTSPLPRRPCCRPPRRSRSPAPAPSRASTTARRGGSGAGASATTRRAERRRWAEPTGAAPARRRRAELRRRAARLPRAPPPAAALRRAGALGVVAAGGLAGGVSARPASARSGPAAARAPGGGGAGGGGRGGRRSRRCRGRRRGRRGGCRPASIRSRTAERSADAVARSPRRRTTRQDDGPSLTASSASASASGSPSPPATAITSSCSSAAAATSGSRSAGAPR